MSAEPEVQLDGEQPAVEEPTKNGDENPEQENADAAKNGTKPEGQNPDANAQPSGKTIYILNIPPGSMFTMENDLKEIFSKYGDVKSVKRASVQVEGSSTEATLSAYINFATTEAAEAALAEQGREYDGRILDMFVLKAGPYSIVADSLPVTMSTDCLKNLLSACGNISKVVKIPGRRTAFIDFDDEEGVKKALSLNGKLMINSIKISIEKRGSGGVPRVKNRVLFFKNKAKSIRAAQRYKRSLANLNNFGGPAGGSGSFGGGYNNRVGNMGRGGRGGAQGGPRGPGGRFGGPNQGGYGGGYGGGGYWGNDDGYNGDGDRPNKRRKPNEWIHQY